LSDLEKPHFLRRRAGAGLRFAEPR